VKGVAQRCAFPVNGRAPAGGKSAPASRTWQRPCRDGHVAQKRLLARPLEGLLQGLAVGRQVGLAVMVRPSSADRPRGCAMYSSKDVELCGWSITTLERRPVLKPAAASARNCRLWG